MKRLVVVLFSDSAASPTAGLGLRPSWRTSAGNWKKVGEPKYYLECSKLRPTESSGLGRPLTGAGRFSCSIVPKDAPLHIGWQYDVTARPLCRDREVGFLPLD